MSRKPKKKTSPEKTSAQSSAGAMGLNGRWAVPGVCIFLAAIVWMVFGQTLHSEFVNFDDSVYVYGNPTVAGGLTWKGVVSMFTQFECNFYHPLTMLSLMLNAQLNGSQPGGYHLGNVLLHTASVILLFLVLRRMTGALWRSAFVAALFAIHPLRVESVAWVAERKDVLSGLFFMLILWAYARYAKERSGTGGPRRAVLYYGLVLLFYTMGLLSKPSIVTLPFVLLLLDYWPLGRFEGQEKFPALVRLIVEKIPLFVLSIGASVVTVMAEGVADTPPKAFSLMDRIGTPIVSYVVYLKQMFYPAGLVPFYFSTPGDVSAREIILGLVLLAGITAAAVAGWRRRPYLLVGWFWYLGVLVPMIGIVQISTFAHADRFTYLAQIGLYLLLTWAVADLCAGWRHRRMVLGACAIGVLAALIFCAHTQAAYWRNSESLWTHTITCDPGNIIAQNDLGLALRQEGRFDNAIAHFQMALQIQPTNAEVFYNLGNVLYQKGDMDEAITNYQQALRIKPNGVEIYNNLGLAFLQKGKVDDSIIQYRQALHLKPDYADAHYNLGNALRQNGRADEAIAQYQQALQADPDHLEAHYNLGNALALKGKTDEAVAHFRRVLQINTNYVKAQATLAWILATAPQASLRNGSQAVELAQHANHLAGGQDPFYLRVLAAAYAEAGRFDDAVQTARKAMDLARAAGRTDIANGLSEELKFYEAGHPYREGNL